MNSGKTQVAAHFTDENAARLFLEKMRWPDGPVCPHCGELNNAYRIQAKAESKCGARKGLWKCAGCKEQFTVTVKTIFEDSHVPLNKWLLAIHLLCASKKGMSAHQLYRMMGTFYGKKGSYKTAWFMFHRLRFAMTQHPFIDKLKGVVEIDETYVGPREKMVYGRPTPERSRKVPVVALMERNEDGGRVRSFPMQRVTLENIRPLMREHVEIGTTVQTDESVVYHFMRDDFPKHDVVTHKKKEYSRREEGRLITTNTVEGYFGLIKRGVYGTYHHVGRGYMQQYLNEFDFRYNNRRLTDAQRVELASKATEAKRLKMKEPKSASAS